MPKSVPKLDPKFVPTQEPVLRAPMGWRWMSAGRAGGQMGIFFFLLAAVQHLVNAGLMLFVWVAMSRRQQGGTGGHRGAQPQLLQQGEVFQALAAPEQHLAFFQSINLLVFAPFALL